MSASLTATIGYLSAPSAAIALRRMTPVVVSSVPPMMCSSASGCSAWMRPTTSAPSSIVICGLCVDRGVDVRVVRLGVLALDREGADAVLGDERGGDVVLRRQRIARAQHARRRRRP